MGDYTNLDIKLDLSLDDQGSLPSLPTGLPTALPTLPTSLPTSEITKILGDVAACLQSGDITSKACQKVLGDPEELLRLITKCKKDKNADNPVCQALNALPSLPTGGPGLPTLTPPDPAAHAPPAHRRGGPAGAVRATRAHRAQLSRLYDPALVSLLVPGMVTGR